MDLEEKLIRTQVVFQGQYLRTEVQTVLLPNGAQSTREIVSPPDAVGILAIDQSSNVVHLVRQYRPAIQKTTIEIPAGIIDGDEDPLETADRECREEIRMKPQRLRPLCSFYHSVGFSTGKILIVLADGLSPVAHSHHEPGEFLEVVTLGFKQFYQMVLSGEVVDSKSIIAALWYQQMKPVNHKKNL